MITVVSKYRFPLGSRLSVTGQLGRGETCRGVAANKHGLQAIHTDGVDTRSEVLARGNLECKGYIDFGRESPILGLGGRGRGSDSESSGDQACGKPRYH